MIFSNPIGGINNQRVIRSIAHLSEKNYEIKPINIEELKIDTIYR